MSAAQPWILAVDTATSRVVVAAASPAGALLGTRTRPAEHRHGERLLPELDALMTEAGLELDALAGIVVGLGPGAFTGLRAGLATAKTMAHELGILIAGVSTGEALLASAAARDGALPSARPTPGQLVLLLPAGPHDRVVVRSGSMARLVPGSSEAADDSDDAKVVAVDLAGRAPEAALARGATALDGLPAALVRLGLQRLEAGSDDPARLVPEYVTLPRGVTAPLGADEGVSWSRDRR